MADQPIVRLLTAPVPVRLVAGGQQIEHSGRMHTGSLIQFGDVDPLNRAAHAVRRWSVNHGGRTFQCAVALRKNEKPLRTALNEWVHANRRNGKRNAIHKKHHGAGLPTKTLS